MNTLATDVQKSAEQLASAQKVAQTEQAFYNFFRTELGRSFGCNDANKALITEYLGDQPITLENIAASVGFIGDRLAAANSWSAARLEKEDATALEEQAQAVRAQQKALWGMSKQDLRTEIRRQAELKNQPKAVVLTNPSTNAEYTKKELLALSASEIRKILTHTTGQSRGIEYRQAFDKILNSQELS
jgi:hypothetical protein